MSAPQIPRRAMHGAPALPRDCRRGPAVPPPRSPHLGGSRAGGGGDVALQGLADGQQVHLGAGLQPALPAASPLQLPHLLLQLGEGSPPCGDSGALPGTGTPRPQSGPGARAEPPGVLPMRKSKPSRAPFLSGSVRVRWAGEKSLRRGCGLPALPRRAATAGGRMEEARRGTKLSQHPKARDRGGRLKPAGAKSCCFPHPNPSHLAARARCCCRHRRAARTRVSCAALARLGPSSAAAEGSPRKIHGQGASGGLSPSSRPHSRSPRALGRRYQPVQPLRVGVDALGGRGLPGGVVHVGVGGREAAQQQPAASRRGGP